MEGRLDLTEGRIAEKLIKLALPIMGTSFINIGYNVVDMIWVGKAGSEAVAAVGTAGFYTWLALAFIAISRVGGEVKVSQSVGNHNIDEAKSYIKSAIEINIVLAILFGTVLIVFNRQLIELFRLGAESVTRQGSTYLIIVGFGMIFYFINPVFTAIFNGLGDSKTPFLINTMGLLTNILLDPILILGVGPFPKMGVAGAAIATISAQAIATFVFIYKIIKKEGIYFKIRYFKNLDFKYHKELFILGLPVAIQSGMFTAFSMCIGVIVARWGPVAIAVQKVGNQIESISYTTADGMASSVSAFVGQNYGANKVERIEKGAKVGIVFAIFWGIITMALLIFGADFIFKFFINEPEALKEGANYLKILGYGEIFQCLEIIVSGILRGLGRTYISSIIVTIFTGARIPMAILLSSVLGMGLTGVWVSITMSMCIKGILMLSVYLHYKKNNKLIVEKETI
ncbi:MATE family efflux transporter [Peptacetobacter sp.]|uniref:MATE family efflux transporter n=1 Tax=Peptacetobacter sp. TaxID=2991975 RepID=UPI0026165E89|nr:MATE family efflux transporter [Peptacetobacter sp.]